MYYESKMKYEYHARIQNFFQGGGGGVQARRSENSLDNVFFVFFSA